MLNTSNNHPKRSSLELQLYWYFKCTCLIQLIATILLSLTYVIIFTIDYNFL
jgi:hypothetical protein